jgi:type II secretory pathway pseudopilin PulG
MRLKCNAFNKKKGNSTAYGFTLTEILVAAGITSVILVGVGTGMVSMITANKRAETNSEQRMELNRAQDFITDEARSAQEMWQTAPTWWPTTTWNLSGTGATGKLYLQVPLQNVLGITSNRIQLPHHGFQNEDAVIFTGTASGTGLILSTPTAPAPTIYYVTGRDDNSFQVTTTPSGAALTLSSLSGGALVPNRLVVYFDRDSDTAWLGPRSIHRSTGPCGTTIATQTVQCPMLIDSINNTADAFTANVANDVVSLKLVARLYDDQSLMGSTTESLGVDTRAKARPVPAVALSSGFTNTSGEISLARASDVLIQVLGGDIRCSTTSPALPTTTTINITPPGGAPISTSIPTSQTALNFTNQPVGTTFTVSAILAGTCLPDKTVNSQTNNGGYVVTLRNGDPVPNRPAYGNNAQGVDAFLRQYIANDRIQLAPNQVIFLFELYTDSPSSSAYDLQDVVVLGTITER